jgi:hypothetical protein
MKRVNYPRIPSDDDVQFDYSPQKFVADVRLGRVERHRGVTDVLRAEEHAEREAVQEVARGYEARHRTQAEVRLLEYASTANL